MEQRKGAEEERKTPEGSERGEVEGYEEGGGKGTTKEEGAERNGSRRPIWIKRRGRAQAGVGHGICDGMTICMAVLLRRMPVGVIGLRFPRDALRGAIGVGGAGEYGGHHRRKI